MTRPVSASVVSRRLREHGFHPLASGTRGRREGITVSQSGPHVFVTVDLDSERRAIPMAIDCKHVLEDEYGYRVAEVEGSGILRVSR